MFEQVQEKLKTLDSVLNEEQLSNAIQLDKKIGFDPTQNYTSKQLEEISYKLKSPKAFIKTRRMAVYLLFGLSLKEQDKKELMFYLRGFDYLVNAHLPLAHNFLEFEISPLLKDFIDIPVKWPMDKNKPEKNIIRRKDELELTITAVGGGKFNLYDFPRNIMNFWGKSESFEAIPTEYQKIFSNLQSQLLQKPTYQNYEIR